MRGAQPLAGQRRPAGSPGEMIQHWALTPGRARSIHRRPGGPQARRRFTCGGAIAQRRPRSGGRHQPERGASSRSSCATRACAVRQERSLPPPAATTAGDGAAGQEDPAERRGGRRDPGSTRRRTRIPRSASVPPLPLGLAVRAAAGRGRPGPGCALGPRPPSAWGPPSPVRQRLPETARMRGSSAPWSTRASLSVPGPPGRSLPLSTPQFFPSAKCDLASGSQHDFGGAPLRVRVQLLRGPMLPWSTSCAPEQSAESRRDLHPLTWDAWSRGGGRRCGGRGNTEGRAVRPGVAPERGSQDLTRQARPLEAHVPLCPCPPPPVGSDSLAEPSAGARAALSPPALGGGRALFRPALGTPVSAPRR